jgi:hypothetical protein
MGIGRCWHLVPGEVGLGGERVLLPAVYRLGDAPAARSALRCIAWLGGARGPRGRMSALSHLWVPVPLPEPTRERPNAYMKARLNAASAAA